MPVDQVTFVEHRLTEVRVERLCAAAAAAAAAAAGDGDDGGCDGASETSSIGMSVNHPANVTIHTSHVTRHASQVGSASAKSWTTWGSNASKKSQVATRAYLPALACLRNVPHESAMQFSLCRYNARLSCLRASFSVILTSFVSEIQVAQNSRRPSS